MGKNVPAHIRLHQHAHTVAHHGDHVVQHALEHVSQQDHGDDRKKGGVELLGQQPLHGGAGHDGEDQVDDRNRHRAEHIDGKGLPVGTKIG